MLARDSLASISLLFFFVAMTYMDEFALSQIRITNLLAQAVTLHDKVGHNVDRITAEYASQSVETSLKDAGPIFKQLTTIYKEIRDASIIFEYLAGHDLFTIANDFKLSHPTIKSVLVKAGITLRTS